MHKISSITLFLILICSTYLYSSKIYGSENQNDEKIKQNCPNGGQFVNGILNCNQKADSPADRESNDPIVEKVYKYCRNQGLKHSECSAYRVNVEKAKLFYERNKCGEIEPDHPDCE